jgi:hypothetical protein
MRLAAVEVRVPQRPGNHQPKAGLACQKNHSGYKNDLMKSVIFFLPL